ncbi:MAG: hypothetical protein HY080_14565 [Gammaproteobacteria bacterium]|nr:hypothetical protein [Gammaproteobacteria bacterium]
MQNNAMLEIDDDIYKSTSRLLLAHVKAEYYDLTNTWRDLERKAQINIAVAGIFITGTSVVLRTLEHPSGAMKLLFLTAFALLALTALLSLRALLISDYESLEDSDEVLTAAQTIYNADDNHTAKQAIRLFVLERVTKLHAINRKNFEANNNKADKVAFAQKVLIVGVSLVIVAVGSAVFAI